MRKSIPLDFKIVCERLIENDALSVNYLAKHYNSAPSVIQRWLDESNIFIAKKNDKKETFLDVKQFSQDVSTGTLTLNEICKKYNLSTRNVHLICKRNNLHENFTSANFRPEDENEFLSYLTKHGKSKTANKYNTTIASVTGWCKRNKIDLQKYLGARKTDIDDKVDEIKALYNTGYTQTFIGKLYETTGAKIKRLLRESGVNTQTKFDVWKEDRMSISSNIDVYAAENANGLNLIEISNRHNISYEVLKDAFRVCGIDVILHSKNKSTGELEVKDFIKSLGLSCESVKRDHKNIKYEIDCFIAEKNFGVEYCGEYWHSRNSGKPRKYHQDKMIWCYEQNINLMTIFEHEWITKQNLIKSMLKTRLGICETKLYARNTECCVISKAQAKLFHDKNHINGGLTTSTIDFGLLYRNELVSVASFSKSRFNKDAEYEILRFSTLQNHLVIGGFSKLFKKFIQVVNPKSVISYCDLRFGKGEVYSKANFKLVDMTPPNYWYYFKDSQKNGTFESRLKYQKHKLKHFSTYRDDKTEYQIMNENGYLQIFDCGNYKFIYENGGAMPLHK